MIITEMKKKIKDFKQQLRDEIKTSLESYDILDVYCEYHDNFLELLANYDQLSNDKKEKVKVFNRNTVVSQTLFNNETQNLNISGELSDEMKELRKESAKSDILDFSNIVIKIFMKYSNTNRVKDFMNILNSISINSLDINIYTKISESDSEDKCYVTIYLAGSYNEWHKYYQYIKLNEEYNNVSDNINPAVMTALNKVLYSNYAKDYYSGMDIEKPLPKMVPFIKNKETKLSIVSVDDLDIELNSSDYMLYLNKINFMVCNNAQLVDFIKLAKPKAIDYVAYNAALISMKIIDVYQFIYTIEKNDILHDKSKEMIEVLKEAIDYDNIKKFYNKAPIVNLNSNTSNIDGNDLSMLNTEEVLDEDED